MTCDIFDIVGSKHVKWMKSSFNLPSQYKFFSHIFLTTCNTSLSLIHVEEETYVFFVWLVIVSHVNVFDTFN